MSHVLFFWPHRMWDLSSPDWKAKSLNHCTARGILPVRVFLFVWLKDDCFFALQCCVGFCHTSTWVSHKFTYIPPLLNLLPTTNGVLILDVSLLKFSLDWAWAPPVSATLTYLFVMRLSSHLSALKHSVVMLTGPWCLLGLRAVISLRWFYFVLVWK